MYYVLIAIILYLLLVIRALYKQWEDDYAYIEALEEEADKWETFSNEWEALAREQVKGLEQLSKGLK